MKLSGDHVWQFVRISAATVVGSVSAAIMVASYLQSVHREFVPRTELTQMHAKLELEHTTLRERDQSVMNELARLTAAVAELKVDIGSLEKRLLEKEVDELRRRLKKE